MLKKTRSEASALMLGISTIFTPRRDYFFRMPWSWTKILISGWTL